MIAALVVEHQDHVGIDVERRDLGRRGEVAASIGAGVNRNVGAV